MDTKALRQKILDLAIRGKLVPQDPNDEPASVLLERIRKQKKQMVKEGKLKAKDIKNDSVIFVGEDSLHYEKFADDSMKCIEDEIPFELPDGWAWSRLRNIIQFIRNGASIKQYKDASGFPITRIETIATGEVDRNRFGYADIFELDKYDSYVMEDYDILMSHINSPKHLGKCALYRRNHDEKIIHGMNLLAIRSIDYKMSEFLCIVFRSEFFKDFVWQNMKQAVNQASITTTSISGLLIPIPPAHEQLMINIAVDNMLDKVNSVDVDGKEIAELIRKTKSKILDLAIRGQLVPQNPDDEPASVLLERIRAEKEELIKQGKIKRDKKESIIFKGEDNSYYETIGKDTVCIDEDLPFNIPDSWHWARLKDVFIINPRNKLNDDFDISFIPMPLIDDGYSGKHTAEVRQWKEVKTGFTHFAEGDVGVAKITPCFENRKSTVFTNLTNGYGAGTTELHILRPIGNSIISQYLLAYLKSDYFVENGKQTFTGAVGQQRISKEYVENAYFPIPSKSEQECIVQTINNMFEYLNVISDALS